MRSERDLLERYRAIPMEIDGEGDPDERATELDAIAAEIVRRHPDAASFWYDRGMFAKWRRDWPASVEYNRTALELTPERERRGEAAAWNLGIAATALHDWSTARLAWNAFGVPVTGEGPIEEDFGPGWSGSIRNCGSWGSGRS
jgi:hypothetical protein